MFMLSGNLGKQPVGVGEREGGISMKGSSRLSCRPCF